MSKVTLIVQTETLGVGGLRPFEVSEFVQNLEGQGMQVDAWVFAGPELIRQACDAIVRGIAEERRRK